MTGYVRRAVPGCTWCDARLPHDVHDGPGRVGIKVRTLHLTPEGHRQALMQSLDRIRADYVVHEMTIRSRPLLGSVEAHEGAADLARHVLEGADA